MEPVDPRMAIFFICDTSSALKHNSKIIDDRRSENHTVEPVQNAAMSRNQLSVILDIVIPFNGRRSQVADLRDGSADRSIKAYSITSAPAPPQ